MKKAILVVALVIAVAAAGSAFAASSTVTVNASVTGKCLVNLAATGTINVGALDPSIAVGTNVTGLTTYAQALRCTKGYAGFTTTFAGGANGYNLTDGTDNIAYTVSSQYLNAGAPVASGLGFGAGKEIDLEVTVTVANGTFADVAMGNYSDTFDVTVTP